MASDGADPLTVLSKAWYNLRLSVRCPARVPTWDAVVLTAASPEQALLYQWHLDHAKRRGTIAPSTIAIAVPDPEGCRIGSGGATLHALRSLAQLLQLHPPQEAEPAPLSQDQASKAECISGMSVLLVHAGGDSKRVPWANPMGKAFLPLPFLADDDPNEQAPSLFDHILALSSYIVQEFKKQGGLFIMTGDVLPCYDFSNFLTPGDGACIVTVPAALDVAANHGVILTSSKDKATHFSPVYCQEHRLQQVVDLLQKPTHSKLLDSGAIRSDGTALLDTGIFAVRGKAWGDLLELAVEEPDPVSVLLQHREEVSLYEEMAGAWVPARHEWLKTRPLGIKLLEALSSQCLFSYCAQELSFLHFGTSLEVLAHLAKDHGGRIGRRHMILTADNPSHELASSAVIISSKIDDGVFVGEESLVFKCTFMDGVHVGNHCIVVGIHSESFPAGTHCLLSLVVPDWHCLWEVPLLGNGSRVTLCCSVHDNPKLALTKMGTFCGKPWKELFNELGIEEDDVWPNKVNNEEKNLWNANLFPVMAPGKGIVFAMWLMGTYRKESDDLLSDWLRCERMSLAGLHSRIDFQKLCGEFNAHQSRISLGLAQASLTCGSLHRNLSKLCTQIVEGLDAGAESCRDLLTLFPEPEAVSTFKVPLSRLYQARLDLCKASEDNAGASAHEKNVWDAVAKETAIAVGQNEVTNIIYEKPRCMFPVSRAKLELPVRVDIAGGWSDTPPWSLERAGTVLNMAILLEGFAPIGAELEVTPERGVSVTDDAGHHLYINDPTMIHPPFEIDDPFRLVKSALVVTGLANASALCCSGLAIKTWANVPRGSGLGTSSILAAAVVKGILQIMGEDDTNEKVTSLVLLLEQLMGTCGGWQDQIGGLYPGIKCTTSFPSRPLTLKVEAVHIASPLQRQLEERLVVFFTGQVRLAHNVLQNVVRRYLQRDTILISTIEQLTHLATKSQEALRVGNLDELGKIMLDVWLLHQELDPFCSNAFVDMVFKKVQKWACGYKLVGAGGGGFGVLLARDKDAVLCVKELLEGLSVQVYNWKLSDNKI